jgi:DNA mismatch endonuclease (patch repair protein)
MSDVLTKTQRSYNMSQIKGINTGPEIKFRKFLFGTRIRGYRVTSKVVGKPDITFTKYKIAIFIDGCYWHKCPLCFKEPNTNKKFWKEKINSNIKRDQKINNILLKDGWKVIRFWEHEINGNIEKCFQKLFLELKKRGFRDATS